MSIRASLLLLLVLGCSMSCAYSTSSRTARDIKTIAVPFFENQTAEPNLEITVTEDLIENLINDNTLKVVPEERADAVLTGAITEFVNRPFSFNNDLDAEEYRLRIRVKATLFKRADNTAIWENQVISGDAAYFVGVANQPTLEDALAEALEEITERILNLTVQDW